MSSSEADLLGRARRRYGVPAAESVAGVVEWLCTLGAAPVDFERYRDFLVDEFVESDLVVVVLTLDNVVLILQRATAPAAFSAPTTAFAQFEARGVLQSFIR